jgi:hypothetical protein
MKAIAPMQRCFAQVVDNPEKTRNNTRVSLLIILQIK